ARAVLQVIEAGVDRAFRGNVRGDRFALGGNRRHGAQARLHAGLLDAAGDLPGHLGGGAVAAVVQHQDVGSAHGSISRTRSGGRPITALSPATRIGRSISLGWAAMAAISCSSLRLGSARLRVLYSSSPLRNSWRAPIPSL